MTPRLHVGRSLFAFVAATLVALVAPDIAGCESRAAAPAIVGGGSPGLRARDIPAIPGERAPDGSRCGEAANSRDDGGDSRAVVAVAARVPGGVVAPVARAVQEAIAYGRARAVLEVAPKTSPPAQRS